MLKRDGLTPAHDINSSYIINNVEKTQKCESKNNVKWIIHFYSMNNFIM